MCLNAQAGFESLSSKVWAWESYCHIPGLRVSISKSGLVTQSYTVGILKSQFTSPGLEVSV